jgi:hypothetical protein
MENIIHKIQTHQIRVLSYVREIYMSNIKYALVLFLVCSLSAFAQGSPGGSGAYGRDASSNSKGTSSWSYDKMDLLSVRCLKD